MKKTLYCMKINSELFEKNTVLYEKNTVLYVVRKERKTVVTTSPDDEKDLVKN